MVYTKVITIGLSTIVHQDDFYKPETLIPLDPKTGLANWDCPGAIDFQSLIETLHYVKEHGEFPEGFDSLEDKNPVGSKEYSTPIPQEVLDPLRDRIMAEAARGQGQDERERTVTKFVILDGFMLYVDEQLRSMIDVRFYLTAPYQILKERRESRKGYATLEGYWVDPPGYFDNTVWPNYLIYNEPFAKLADAIDEGQISGVYDAIAADQELLRADPMTQRVDIVSSRKDSIHAMVEFIANLLAKRISEL
ncbi:ribosylnicotinamide kinase [Haplosporangium gracile]|nr:ribosylnicotinamide kinase [Haplosporangium gracile]